LATSLQSFHWESRQNTTMWSTSWRGSFVKISSIWRLELFLPTWR